MNTYILDFSIFTVVNGERGRAASQHLTLKILYGSLKGHLISVFSITFTQQVQKNHPSFAV